MSWFKASSVCVLSIALAAAAAVSLAEDKASEKTADDEAGFVKLFNGKDLTGWVYGGKNGELKSGKGYLIDEATGVLYSTAEDGGNLYTEKQYKDFIFRFDFKLTANANNGVGIRAPIEGDSAYQGMEIQVLDDSGPEYQGLRPEQYHGSIYDLVAAKKGSQKPVGEWNTEEITAKGRHITIKVNGQTIVDADLDEVKKQLLEKDPEKFKRHPGMERDGGHIGFLGHGRHVEFRNIRIKEL